MSRALHASSLVLRATGVLAVLAFATLCAPMDARAEWVRDEVRINLRTGPGTKFRIVESLRSGDRARQVSQADGWIEVELPSGVTGWVPEGYLVNAEPASVQLPQLEARLEEADAKIRELTTRLDQQTSAILELETLRSRNKTLERENVEVAGAARWKSMGMGAAIVLIGMVIGLLAPRGAQGRSRKLKL